MGPVRLCSWSDRCCGGYCGCCFSLRVRLGVGRERSRGVRPAAWCGGRCGGTVTSNTSKPTSVGLNEQLLDARQLRGGHGDAYARARLSRAVRDSRRRPLTPLASEGWTETRRRWRKLWSAAQAYGGGTGRGRWITTRSDTNVIAVIWAAGQGFEPRFHDPESRVLPLDDPAMTSYVAHRRYRFPLRQGNRRDF